MSLFINDSQRRAYLHRIGIDPSMVADLKTLRQLHESHLRSIPFENLDIHLSVPIVLEFDSLIHKITTRRRGGFCYELNGAFAALLSALSYEVQLLEARVFSDGKLGRPFDHLCLKVQLESAWLCDVGFGQCFRYPIRLDSEAEQSDPNGVYRLSVPTDEPECLDLRENSSLVYRLSSESRQLEDFSDMCRYHQSSSDSSFTQNSLCSIATTQGRVTLKGRTLIETIGSRKSQRDICNDVELLELYRARFGVELDRLPAS